MSEEHPHPLLQQLPLTVSPYLSLPTATPLPYAYKSLPSTLPPSVIEPRSENPQHHQSDGKPSKPEYVISTAGGHSAHPDSIIESCRALQAHLDRLQADSEATIRKWDSGIKEKELAERKRVAPGWLDVGEESRILVPQRKEEVHHEDTPDLMDTEIDKEVEKKLQGGDEGDALDRAFGGMNVQ